MNGEELKIRLEEQLRIYKDSPTTQAFYSDIARLIEDLLEILRTGKKIGFK